jgi:hypothetical protein
VKEQCTFRVDDAILKRLRNAVKHNRGAPRFLTLDGFVERTLDTATRRLERDGNGGEEYGDPGSRTPKAKSR